MTSSSRILKVELTLSIKATADEDCTASLAMIGTPTTTGTKTSVTSLRRFPLTPRHATLAQLREVILGQLLATTIQRLQDAGGVPTTTTSTGTETAEATAATVVPPAVTINTKDADGDVVLIDSETEWQHLLEERDEEEQRKATGPSSSSSSPSALQASSLPLRLSVDVCFGHEDDDGGDGDPHHRRRRRRFGGRGGRGRGRGAARGRGGLHHHHRHLWSGDGPPPFPPPPHGLFALGDGLRSVALKLRGAGEEAVPPPSAPLAPPSDGDHTSPHAPPQSPPLHQRPPNHHHHHFHHNFFPHAFAGPFGHLPHHLYHHDHHHHPSHPFRHLHRRHHDHHPPEGGECPPPPPPPPPHFHGSSGCWHGSSSKPLQRRRERLHAVLTAIAHASSDLIDAAAASNTTVHEVNARVLALLDAHQYEEAAELCRSTVSSSPAIAAHPASASLLQYNEACAMALRVGQLQHTQKEMRKSEKGNEEEEEKAGQAAPPSPTDDETTSVAKEERRLTTEPGPEQAGTVVGESDPQEQEQERKGKDTIHDIDEPQDISGDATKAHPPDEDPRQRQTHLTETVVARLRQLLQSGACSVQRILDDADLTPVMSSPLMVELLEEQLQSRAAVQLLAVCPSLRVAQVLWLLHRFGNNVQAAVNYVLDMESRHQDNGNDAAYNAADDTRDDQDARAKARSDEKSSVDDRDDQKEGGDGDKKRSDVDRDNES